MSAIRRCERHGYFDGSSCPACGTDGAVFLASSRRTRLSKFVSGALRHFPAEVGLSLDSAGWADFEDVATAAADRYPWADATTLTAVVETDPKGRFERRDGRIRAAYGHSVDVTLEAADGSVPAVLYHGTAPSNLPSIRRDGLQPMNRRSVHLSSSVDDARAVGRRHASTPVVIGVDARAMQVDGLQIDKRGRATYTTDTVPPEYLDLGTDRDGG